jgi:hypothetical protein
MKRIDLINEGFEKYYPLFEKAFGPVFTCTQLQNKADLTYGWIVSPDPENTIKFTFYAPDDIISIRIEKAHVSFSNRECCFSTVFRGCLPITKHGQPNLEFLTEILRNFKNIG